MAGELNTSLFNEIVFNDGSVITVPPTPTIGDNAHSVVIDWDNDGDFSGDYEDVTSLVFVEHGITCERGKDQIQQLSPPQAGSSNLALRNQDKLFSIWNTSSPLFGQLKPGRKFQWRMVVNDTRYALYSGLTQRLPQHPAFGEKFVEVTTLGTLSRLVGKKVSTELYADITTGTAIGYVLDAAGWPSTERTVDDGQCTLSFWHADGTKDAWTEITELLMTEGLGAAVFEDGSGTFIFQDRSYRQTYSTSSEYTFATSGTSGNVRVFAGDEGIDDVINSCELEVVTRAIQDESVIWQLGAVLDLAPDETRKLTVKAASGDPFMNAVVPDPDGGRNEIQELLIAGTVTGGTIGVSFEGVTAAHAKNALALGYSSNASDVELALWNMTSIGSGNVDCTGIVLATGIVVEFTGDLAKQDVELISVSSQLTGTNATATCILIQEGAPPDYVLASGSIASITLSRTSGADCVLTITAGASGALIEGLQVRGQLVTVTATTQVTNTVDASDSIADYGDRPFKPTTRKEMSQSFAQSYCDDTVSYYKDPKVNVQVQMLGFDDALLEQMVSLDVSHRVTITDSHSGLNKDFYIEKVKHDYDEFNLYTTFFCEEAGDATVGGGSDVGIWDEGLWDDSSWGY